MFGINVVKCFDALKSLNPILMISICIFLPLFQYISLNKSWGGGKGV